MMAECGICLDVLRNPVAIPCGHVHCERCLRAHVNSGADALSSACPTCRKPFHIATPDFAFVPQKYHDFILPSVRRIYMDIPSVAKMAKEVAALTLRLEAFTNENDRLRDRCAEYRHGLEKMVAEKVAVLEKEEETQQETADLRRKYDSLKKKYWETLSRDKASNTSMPQSLSHRSSQNFDTSHDIIPKVEEHPVSLQDMSSISSRPKRALPRPRLSNGMRRKDEQAPQCVKRQRIHRHSNIGSSSQVVFQGEDEEDE